MHTLFKYCNLLIWFSLASIIRIIDPNSNFDRLWTKIIDETLEDDAEEEIMRCFREVQQETDNTTCPKRRKKVMHRNHEDSRRI